MPRNKTSGRAPAGADRSPETADETPGQPAVVDWGATGRALGAQLSLLDDLWREVAGEVWEGLREAEADDFCAFLRGVVEGWAGSSVKSILDSFV